MAKPNKQTVNNIPNEFALPPVGQTSKFDPFSNLEDLSISQDFSAIGGGSVKRLAVNHRKPGSSTFFRTHPDFQLTVGCLELKDQGSDTYLVVPNMCTAVSEIAGNCYSTRLLVPWINRQNEISLWSLKLPSNDGRSNDWLDSAIEAASTAKSTWLRLTANMRQGRYDIFIAENQSSNPSWPNDLEFIDMVKMAFKNKLVDSLDHILIKQIQGRI